MTGHGQEQTHPNLYSLAGDDLPLTLLKRGCANSVVGLELAETYYWSRSDLCAPKLRDSLRLQRRLFTAVPQNRAIVKALRIQEVEMRDFLSIKDC